jgi:hypothetical protein
MVTIAHTMAKPRVSGLHHIRFLPFYHLVHGAYILPSHGKGMNRAAFRGDTLQI